MSYFVYGWILDRYGSPRLTMRQLAEVLGRGAKSVANTASKPDFPIRTYLDGGTRYADVRDVMAYLDARREQQETPA
jgi:hypothetical protein